MMSNALCLLPVSKGLWTVAASVLAFALTAGSAAASGPTTTPASGPASNPTTAPTSAPTSGSTTAPAAEEAIHPLLMGLTAMGICVLVAWGVRCFSRPARLTLRGTPARPNRLNPLHLLLCLVVWWLTLSATYAFFYALLLRPLGDTELSKVLAPRYKIAAGTIASCVWFGVSLGVAGITFRHGLGRGLGLSARRWLADGLRAVLGYLAVLPVCMGLLLLTAFLFLVFDLHKQVHPVLEGLSAFPPRWKLLALFSTVVVAPLAEEVFFRGLLQSLVRQYTHRPWLSILVASTFFAAVHFDQPQAIPSLFALSVALGYNYERTGRLFAPILIHALFNIVNLIAWTSR